jgi:hypothetical protein
VLIEVVIHIKRELDFDLIMLGIANKICYHDIVLLNFSTSYFFALRLDKVLLNFLLPFNIFNESNSSITD